MSDNNNEPTVATEPSTTSSEPFSGANLMDSFLASGDAPTTSAFDAAPAAAPVASQTGFPDEPFVMPTAPVATPAARPTSRVFDGLLPEEVRLFRDMGNDSYAKLYPAYLELRKLQGRAGEVERFAGEHEKLRQERDELNRSKFFEHENAWQLDPQVTTLAQNVSQVAKEINHWTESLALIDAGEPFHPIILDASGKPIISPDEHQPTPSIRAQVYSALVEAHTIKRDLDNKIGNVRQNFSANYQGYVGKVNDVNKQWFGKFETALAPKRAELLQSLPLASRNRPETQLAANAMVALQLAIDEIAKMKAASNAHLGNAGARAGQPPINPGNGVQASANANGEYESADAIKLLRAMTRGQASGL